MKIFLVALTAVGILAIAGSGSALAQGKAQGVRSKAIPARIAILNVNLLMRHSKAGKSIRKQLDARRKALRKEAGKEEKKMRAARNELRLQRSLLSPEAMREREKKFKDKLGQIQRKFNTRKRNLEKSLAAARKELDQNLKTVLDGVVAEMGIDLILNRRHTIFTRKEFEITAIVRKRLDARIKKVTLKKPGK